MGQAKLSSLSLMLVMFAVYQVYENLVADALWVCTAFLWEEKEL